jgi:hypothetical protein
MEEAGFPEQEASQGAAVSVQHNKPHKLPEVIVVRNFKEYLGESLLIVFSVLLALIVTEAISRFNERREMDEVVKDLRDELAVNKSVADLQYRYHLSVLKNIDSAIKHKEFADQFMHDGIISLEPIANHGILYGTFSDAAWQVARNKNIASRIGVHNLGLLTSIYFDQERVVKVENEIGHLLLSPESRNSANLRITLILMRDNYVGWATERIPGLLFKYDQELKELDK